MAQQLFSAGQALAYGVDVYVEALGRKPGILIAIEVAQQSCSQVCASFAILRNQNPDDCFQKIIQACLVVRLKQDRIQRHFILAQNLTIHPQALCNEKTASQR